MVHPCCGGSLRKGTKTVAILQIVWNAIVILTLVGLVTLGLGLKVYEHAYGSNCTTTKEYINSDSNSTERTEIQHDGFNTTELIEDSDPFCDGKFIAVMYGVTFLLCLDNILSLIFAVILLLAANEENARKCTAWLISRIFLAFLTVVTATFMSPELFLLPIEMFLNAYFIWIVYRYRQEIRENEEEHQSKF